MRRAADIEEEAIEWMIRREKVTWTQRDEEALTKWLAEDSAHHISMLRLNSVWMKADRLRATRPQSIEIGEKSYRTKPMSKLGWVARRTKEYRAALVAAILLVIGMPVYTLSNSAGKFTTIVGGYQQILLKDGSKIDLNTNSQISVEYGSTDRHISLARGEAYFVVEKDKTRPFIVETDNWKFVAVGTAFTVIEESGVSQMVVTEGSVRVEAKGPNLAKFEPVIATAGHVVNLTNSKLGSPSAELAIANPHELEPNWREGWLVFEGQSLKDAAAEMNRYNHIKITVDDSVANIPVDGSFKTTNAYGFIRLIKEGFGVTVTRTSQNEVFLEKK